MQQSPTRRILGATIVAASFAFFATACGNATANEGSYFAGAAAAADEASGTRTEIVSEQIRQVETSRQNAYEVVRELRPQWLRSRGRNSLNPAATNDPRVYLDRVHYGGLEWLSEIRSDQIARIEYLSPTDATTLWGTGHTGGVIHVFTRRR